MYQKWINRSQQEVEFFDNGTCFGDKNVNLYVQKREAALCSWYSCSLDKLSTLSVFICIKCLTFQGRIHHPSPCLFFLNDRASSRARKNSEAIRIWPLTMSYAESRPVNMVKVLSCSTSLILTFISLVIWVYWVDSSHMPPRVPLYCHMPFLSS